MRKKILTVLVIPLVAALTAQAAAASGYHHTRTKAGVAASEQFRNSNAYAPSLDVAVPSESSRYQGQALVPGAY